MATNNVDNNQNEYHSVPLDTTANKSEEDSLDNQIKIPHSNSTSQISDLSPTPVVPQHQNIKQSSPPPQNHRRIFKIIVIGDSNVGKTCLTFRFCGGKFLQRSEATIGVDFREKTILIDDETIKLQIWDTAGQERFRKSMISHYYRNVHAVLFVYDVTNIGSFENLSYWIEEFNRHCATLPSFNQIPRILVGNKCDLASDVRVNTNVAQTFADMHQMPLFETSAKDDSRQDHVEAIFMTLALKLKNSKPFYVPTQLHKAKVDSVDHGNNSSNNDQTEKSSSSGACYC